MLAGAEKAYTEAVGSQATDLSWRFAQGFPIIPETTLAQSFWLRIVAKIVTYNPHFS